VKVGARRRPMNTAATSSLIDTTRPLCVLW